MSYNKLEKNIEKFLLWLRCLCHLYFAKESLLTKSSNFRKKMRCKGFLFILWDMGMTWHWHRMKHFMTSAKGECTCHDTLLVEYSHLLYSQLSCTIFRIWKDTEKWLALEVLPHEKWLALRLQHFFWVGTEKADIYDRYTLHCSEYVKNQTKKFLCLYRTFNLFLVILLCLWLWKPKRQVFRLTKNFVFGSFTSFLTSKPERQGSVLW